MKRIASILQLMQIFITITLDVNNDIHLISCRLSHGHRCITSKAASLYNALPTKLTIDMYVSMFEIEIDLLYSVRAVVLMSYLIY
jgi:hypothetical protein